MNTRWVLYAFIYLVAWEEKKEWGFVRKKNT